MRKLPSNIHAEHCVLSAMMLDVSNCGYACTELTELHFTKKGDQLIFNAIIDMYNKNIAVDVVTIIEYLTNINQIESVGGHLYLNELSDVVLSTANIEHHSNILIEKWKLRTVINENNKITNLCYTQPDDPDKIVNDGVANLIKITNKSKDKFFVNPLESNKKALQEIQNNMNGKTVHLKTDISELDKYIQLRAGTLLNIKADTSVGKSVLGMQIAFTNIVNRGSVGLIVTGEMTDDELLMREYARHTDIASWRIFKGQINPDELQRISNYAEYVSGCKYKIMVGALNIQGIRQKAQQVLHEYKKLDFIIVDYLQQMIPEKAEKREQEIAGLSRGCKRLAVEFQIPIIEMTQVNQKGQARESRGIEQDTDIEMYLRRPHKEGFKEYTKLSGETIEPTEKDAFVKITKNRKGKLGTVELEFLGDRQMFIDPYDNMYNGD